MCVVGVGVTREKMLTDTHTHMGKKRQKKQFEVTGNGTVLCFDTVLLKRMVVCRVANGDLWQLTGL